MITPENINVDILTKEDAIQIIQRIQESVLL